MHMNNSIKQIYDQKMNYSILALTGLEGSGCTFLSEIMNKKKEDFLKLERLRKPDTFAINTVVQSVDNAENYKNNTNNDGLVNQLIFHRKYSICYNFYKEYYIQYSVIKYTKVCWLYTLLFLRETAGSDNNFTKEFLKEQLQDIFLDKFMSSKTSPEEDKEYCNIFPNLEPDGIKKLIDSFSYENVVDEINSIYCDEFRNPRGDNAKKITDVFFDDNSVFSLWYKSVTEKITQKDYYRTCYFYHRLATVLRTFGDPRKPSDRVKDYPIQDHVFCIIEMINSLIKGLNEGIPKRVVIDSIRNSTELSYLKDRYNAFYVIAVSCSDNERDTFIEKKLTVEDKNKEITRKVIRWITDIEAGKQDHDKGRFACPDTELCFADAEIHITNSESKPKDDDYSFSSIEEQWMKYASLLMHPGLITPSPEERCMAVAYTARLNSSCVSRQVGAVITNQFHAIRTIGWNDVPFGQVACGLRDLRDHLKDSYSKEEEWIYSEFERNETEKRYSKKCFRECVLEDYADLKKVDNSLKGLPAPYCFRTLDNRYTGEINQTQTRSLHAEENAMLQMVKYGGEPLRNGIIYVTDSPCELCSKKLYQIGVRRIVYIDIYPGIANDNITHNGLKQPELVKYKGAYGSSYIKLFRPILSLKDELSIRTGNKHAVNPSKDLLGKILEKIGRNNQKHFSDTEVEEILSLIPEKK